MILCGGGRAGRLLGLGAALGAGIALLCLGLSIWQQSRLAPLGLTLTVEDGEGRTLLRRPWPVTDLATLEARGPGLPGPWQARLSGFIWIPRAARYVVLAKAEGGLRLRLAEQEVLQHRPLEPHPRTEAELSLPRGFVPIEMVVDSRERDTLARLRLAEVDARPVLPEAERLYSDVARWSDRPNRERVVRLRRAAAFSLVLALVLAAGVCLAERVRGGRWPSVLRVAPPLLLLLLALLLRFQALVQRFWLADTPPWAYGLSQVITLLTPAELSWPSERSPYGGDPWTYLAGARAGHGFYDANGREPVFIFATRLMLWLVGGDNLGVNLASAFFSALTVLAVYALGAVAFNRVVGCCAALLFAVEPGIVSLAVEGWRDDASAFGVMACAAALLAFERRPSPRRAVLLGALCALACLTRITALSFVVPGLLFCAWRLRRAGREAWRALGLAALLLLVLVAPYLISCAIAFGDPLYAINIHTAFYRARQGLEADSSMGWLQFLGSSRRPLATLDTLLAGLTLYPFENKWTGLRLLLGPVGTLLQGSAVIGLLALLFSRTGRFLLAVLLSSLLPFAFTWDVQGGAEWRFTLHAYGFYLVAATWILGLAAEGLWRSREAAQRPPLRPLAGRVLALIAVAALLLGALCLVHHLRVRSDIAHTGAAVVRVGLRDATFFGRGWSRPRRTGHGVIRQTEGHGAALYLPLGAPDPLRTYRVRFGVGLVCETGVSLPVDVTLNGSPLARLVIPSSQAGPRPIVVALPPGRTRDGLNTLELRAAGALAAPCDQPRAFWLKTVNVDAPRRRPVTPPSVYGTRP